jgi:hypothetical protein
MRADMHAVVRLAFAIGSIAGVALVAGCSEGLEGAGEEGSSGSDQAEATSSGTVQDAVTRACSTTAVRGLATQLVEEIQCLRPGTMAPINGIPNVSLSSAVFPFLQAPAATALRNASSRARRTIFVNSALRTLPQQYLLHRWYRLGRCNIRLAAQPGTSNHEGGIAVDIEDAEALRSVMSGASYRWFGPSDPVHFDFVGGGAVSLEGLSTRAFQRLWNRNNPNDRIAEDGDYGPATESRLARSPANGFAIGACKPASTGGGGGNAGSGTGGGTGGTGGGGGTTSPATQAIEVFWARTADGSYDLRAIAPASIRRVEYAVDGFVIGRATRADGENFPASYRFSQPGEARRFEVKGYDAAGNAVGSGVGQIDVTASAGQQAVFIRQMGAALYEIGFDVAPAGVTAIEVRADDFLLTDSVSRATRSTRLSVRSTFTRLGERTFQITTFGADGRARGTITRKFTLQ